MDLSSMGDFEAINEKEMKTGVGRFFRAFALKYLILFSLDFKMEIASNLSRRHQTRGFQKCVVLSYRRQDFREDFWLLRELGACCLQAF